jgi:hypothetical protein
MSLKTNLDCELSIFAAACKMVGNGQIVLYDAKNNNNMSAAARQPAGKLQSCQQIPIISKVSS